MYVRCTQTKFSFSYLCDYPTSQYICIFFKNMTLNLAENKKNPAFNAQQKNEKRNCCIRKRQIIIKANMTHALNCELHVWCVSCLYFRM